MTLKGRFDGDDKEIVLQKVSSPTEEEIKKAVH
jgi:hypothetical protein